MEVMHAHWIAGRWVGSLPEAARWRQDYHDRVVADGMCCYSPALLQNKRVLRA